MINGSYDPAGLESADPGSPRDPVAGRRTREWFRDTLTETAQICEALHEHKAAGAIRDVLARFAEAEAKGEVFEAPYQGECRGEAVHGEDPEETPEVTLCDCGVCAACVL